MQHQKSRPALALLTVTAVAIAAAGCDAQAVQGYPGEPLVTLHGKIGSPGSGAPVEAAMLWQRGEPPSTADQELATRAPVESGFPATFTLRLYQPPPTAARRRLLPAEVTYARANAAAVPFGIAAPAVGSLPSSANPGYGVDVDHWVVWLDGPAAAGSVTAWWLGAALPAGFHLLKVAQVNPACLNGDPLDACLRDLAARGAPDDGTTAPGTARGFCLASYRLAPAADGELIVLQLGTDAPAPGGAGCP